MSTRQRRATAEEAASDGGHEPSGTEGAGRCAYSGEQATGHSTRTSPGNFAIDQDRLILEAGRAAADLPALRRSQVLLNRSIVGGNGDVGDMMLTMIYADRCGRGCGVKLVLD